MSKESPSEAKSRLGAWRTGLVALLALLAAGADARAETRGHWRFEPAPGLLQDSSGNGLSLSTQGTAPVAHPLPASGPGASFSRVIAANGETNTQAAHLGTPAAGNFFRVDGPAFTLTNFTLEALAHRTQVPDITQYLASQWEFTSASQRSWGVGLAGTTPPSGLVSNELFLVASSNGTVVSLVGSGLRVPVGQDYYVAVSFDLTNRDAGIVFYAKNLSTNGPLLASVRSHALPALFDSTARFAIGAYNNGANRFSGVMDEVRLSDQVLAIGQLLLDNPTNAPVLPPPIIATAPGAYLESVTVELTATVVDGEIRYTLDGAAPDAASLLYAAPITLTSNAVITARSFKPGAEASPPVSASFSVLPFPYLGQIQPRHAREIEDSNWSVGGEVLDRDYAVFSSYRDYLGWLGAKRIRFQAGWAKTEKTPGVYDWGWLDEAVNGALARGVRPWLETSYGNPIYAGGGGTNLGAGLPTSAEALAAWDQWVRALVQRYRDRVSEWEVWNEPDGHVTAEAYADFYVRTAEIIRAEQTNAALYALALAGIGSSTYLNTFLARLQSSNKLDLVTAVTCHGYPKNPDDAHASMLNLLAAIRNYSPVIQLRQGESGAPSTLGSAGALSDHPFTELTQAKWDLRRMLGDYSYGFPSSVFTIIEFAYPTTGLNTKGLLKVNPDKTVAYAKPAYYAVQHLTAVFDQSLERLANFSASTDVPGRFRVVVCRKQDTGKSVVAAWMAGAIPAEANTKTLARLTISPVDFTEPVWVDLREGRMHLIPEAFRTVHGTTNTFTNIPVYDSPILLADRSCLPLASPRQLWTRAHFSIPEQEDAQISGEAADPDQDGLSNFEEYLFGASPRQADAQAKPKAEWRDGRFGLAFWRGKFATDYWLRAGASTNLRDWDEAGVEEVVIAEEANARLIRAEFPRAWTNQPAGFMRLRALPSGAP